MRDGNGAIEPGQSGAERARRVALDDQQSGRRGEMPAQRAPNPGDMGIGMGQAGAIEVEPAQMREAMLGRIEAGMLAGEDQPGVEPAVGERGGDWRQFDSFGPGADDQPDFSGTQPSP